MHPGSLQSYLSLLSKVDKLDGSFNKPEGSDGVKNISSNYCTNRSRIYKQMTPQAITFFK